MNNHRSLQSALADDSLVIQYQTIGQYRSALLAAFPSELPTRAAASQEAKPIAADGWRLVPVEPTDEMLRAAHDWSGKPLGKLSYRAMLAAALQQPATATNDLRDRNWSKPATQQGMFRKYDVRRVDGRDLAGGKHHGCLNYVIDVDHDPAADATMRTYAGAIRETHPLLASDILAELDLRVGRKTLARMRAENEAADALQSQPQQVTK